MKVSQLLSNTVQEFTSLFDTARLDAEVLLAYGLGWKRTHLITRDNQTLTSKQLAKIKLLVARRIKGEPIAYIVGKQEFWSLELEVSSCTLIPRPETELLVETALTILKENKNQQVLDLGTGSGAIALALASECSDHEYVAVDASLDALIVAERNIKNHKISNIDLIFGSWFSPFKNDKFDLIVSNPPYIESGDQHLTQGDVMYEPIEALASGDDGLDDIRVICKEAQTYMNKNAWLMIEHGWNQAEKVRAIFNSHAYRNVKSITDLSNIERITIAQN